LRARPSKRAITRIQAVVVIAVILVGALSSVYLYLSSSKKPTTSTTHALPSTLVVEESDKPDSLDPAVTFETPGWEIVNQIYQGLVAPDRTSITTYVGVLAQSWTVSGSGMNYTFNLRHGVTFSNGDPFNAYVMWFSIYRNLVMSQALSFVLGQNLGYGTVTHGPTSNVTDVVLNSINYANPSQDNLTYMEYPDQSVQVMNASQIVFNLGYGYNGVAPFSAFLATLTTVMADAIDPVVVEANGGVVAGTPNDYMQTHAVGTGPYELKSWIQGQSISLVKNPNYWGNSLPASQLNYAIQPASIAAVNIYDKPTSAMIADLKSGFAQMVELPTTQYSVVKQLPGVTATILPPVFGSAEYAYFIYMDPYTPSGAPFQDVRVRHAVADAIDYQAIIHSVLADNGVQWVGPVPPGFQFYSQATSGLQNYTFNPAEAAQLLAQAGYKNQDNPSGLTFPTMNFLYDVESDYQNEASQIIQTELSAIGINVVPTPLTFVRWGNVVGDTTTVNSTQYPIGLNYWAEDYTNSIDYVEEFTQSGQLGVGGYYNATVYGWTTTAATSPSDATPTIISAYQNVTQAMYYNYTDVWLFVPKQLAVNTNNVAGVIPNPLGGAMAYFMYYSDVYYIS
jgi:peptide/nickel transport system substrate-binding protein